MISQTAPPNCMSIQSVSFRKEGSKIKQFTYAIIMFYNNVKDIRRGGVVLRPAVSVCSCSVSCQELLVVLTGWHCAAWHLPVFTHLASSSWDEDLQDSEQTANCAVPVARAVGRHFVWTYNRQTMMNPKRSPSVAAVRCWMVVMVVFRGCCCCCLCAGSCYIGRGSEQWQVWLPCMLSVCRSHVAAHVHLLW